MKSVAIILFALIIQQLIFALPPLDNFDSDEIAVIFDGIYGENALVHLIGSTEVPEDRKPQILQKLVDIGADTSVNDNWPIRWASIKGHDDAVRVLLTSERTDPAAMQNAPIRLASMHGHVNAVRTLLADPRVDPTSFSSIPLLFAADKNYTDIVQMLANDPRTTIGACLQALKLARKYHYEDTIALLKSIIKEKSGKKKTSGCTGRSSCGVSEKLRQMLKRRKR